MLLLYSELKPNQNPRIKILPESLSLGRNVVRSMLVLVRRKVSPVSCCKVVYVQQEPSSFFPIQSGRDRTKNRGCVWSLQPHSGKGALCFSGRIYVIQGVGLLEVLLYRMIEW